MKGQTNRTILRNRLQRRLRKAMTDAEQVLWKRLKQRQIAGHKFRRQHPFLDYVLDFVCLEAKLVVKVDGGQHADSAKDAARDHELKAAGFRIVRFWNNQVLQETDAVVEAILLALQPHPHPVLPPEGEGTY